MVITHGFPGENTVDNQWTTISPFFITGAGEHATLGKVGYTPLPVPDGGVQVTLR